MRTLNMNKATDVNESKFPDLASIQEITEVEDIHKYLGDIVILDRWSDHFDDLIDRVVDIATLCWGNINPTDGTKLQQTHVNFKVDIDDETC